jgi:hypothetical protein
MKLLYYLHEYVVFTFEIVLALYSLYFTKFSVCVMGYFTTARTQKKAQLHWESLHDSTDMEQTQGLERKEPRDYEEPQVPDDTEELTPLPLPKQKTKESRKPKVLVLLKSNCPFKNKLSFCIIYTENKQADVTSQNSFSSYRKP